MQHTLIHRVIHCSELPTDLQEQAMSKYRQLSKRRFALENTCRNSLDARIDLALKSAVRALVCDVG